MGLMTMMKPSSSRMFLQISMMWKIAALVVCFGFAFFGKYPPLRAQDQRQQGSVRYDLIPATTVGDEHRDDLLSSHDEKITALENRVSKQWDAANANSMAIAAMQEENRILQGLLGLLVSGSITFQAVSNKKRS
jgi:hypothetical protein